MDIKKIIDSLTIEEKISLLSGAAMFKTKEIPEKGVEALRMSDGPNGVRKLNDKKEKDQDFGLSDPLESTAFPTGSTLAMTWNKDILFKVGKGIARECKYHEVDAILGPSMNIKRSPLCGRNFEYYSEDPYLTSVLARNYINGVQGENVLATPKHFACNHNEKWRYVGDSLVDERALREIYLKAFEDVVKECKPGMIMSAYNKINGEHASQNQHVLNEILRKEWGFDGISLTDWGGLLSRTEALKAQTDLEMPGCVQENLKELLDSFNEGKVSEEEINRSVERILLAIEKTHKNNKLDETVLDENKEVALEAALEAMTLLKNENNILPLDVREKVLCVGCYFTQPRYQGGGSSILNPKYFVTPYDAFKEHKIDYFHEPGYVDYEDIVREELEFYVMERAEDYETILFFGGQTDYEESEGFDKSSMRLPECQIHLLNKLIKLGKRIILVLYGGSQVELDMIDGLAAVLYVGLPGQMGGEAIYQTLFGMNNPSGRTMETWALKYNDHLVAKDFATSPYEVYKESIYVGYRYFDTASREVRFPFGYGLSYTEFKYSDLNVSKKKDRLVVTFNVENLSHKEGKDVPQIYVGMNNSLTFRPLKELKGFEKVHLEAYENKKITIEILYKDLMIYDLTKDKFTLEGGEYTVYLAKNVNEVVDQVNVKIEGEKLLKEDNHLLDAYFDYKNLNKITNENFKALYKRDIPVFKGYKKPYGPEVPLFMMKGFFAKILRNQTKATGFKLISQGTHLPEGRKRQRYLVTGSMIDKSVNHNCVRSIVNSSGGSLSYVAGQGLLEIANGHPIKGLKKVNLKNY